MPLSKKTYDEAIDLRKLKEESVEKLKTLAHELGFICSEEVPTSGGRVDLVWFHKFMSNLPILMDKLPVVGFEIETSWRTRKHIKGDIFNLLELSPALGVILLLSKGFKEHSKLHGNVEAAKRYVHGFSGICRIHVWTEKEIQEILNAIGNKHSLQ